MSDTGRLEIRVKVGDVEIEYIDSFGKSERPWCVNTYYLAKSDKRQNEWLFETVKLISKEAGSLHSQMYGQSEKPNEL